MQAHLREKATHQQAMKIGKPLFKAMANHKDGGLPDVISSDCPLGGQLHCPRL